MCDDDEDWKLQTIPCTVAGRRVLNDHPEWMDNLPDQDRTDFIRLLKAWAKVAGRPVSRAEVDWAMALVIRRQQRARSEAAVKRGAVE